MKYCRTSTGALPANSQVIGWPFRPGPYDGDMHFFDEDVAEEVWFFLKANAAAVNCYA